MSTLTLSALVRAKAPIGEIAALLDGLDHDGRQAQLATLSRGDFGPLYEAAAGRHVDLAFYVPPDLPEGEPVRHVGLNSMPFFRTVDKRFVRSPEDPGVLWGYNQLDNPVARGFSGPGYFTVRPRPGARPDGRTDTDQLFIDYWQVPPRQPRADWPPVAANDRLPGSLVYGRMCDYMWRVSDHVSIGEAYRAGRSLRTWFIVSRQDR